MGKLAKILSEKIGRGDTARATSSIELAGVSFGADVDGDDAAATDINRQGGELQSADTSLSAPSDPHDTSMSASGGGAVEPVGGVYYLHSLSQEENESQDNIDDNEEAEHEMSLAEIMYGAKSYHAIVKPVSLTMILAALSAVNINTEVSMIQGQQALSEAYTVWTIDDFGSTGSAFAKSLGNAFIMVVVMGAATFVIVFLYKYSFASLLGLMGSVMFDVAIDRYQLPIDVLSYYFVLWNFAAVGTISIFWQAGIPSNVTQGYLIVTSVILAWHFSHFDEWTAWTLLVMLALYDLCAVLTPWGPLKFLVNEMQVEGAPQMPGLLYEAELEGGGRVDYRRRGEVEVENMRQAQHPIAREEERRPGLLGVDEHNGTSGSRDEDGPPPIQYVNSGIGTPGIPAVSTSLTSHSSDASGSDSSSDSSSSSEAVEAPSTIVLPLAIAKLYRLPAVSAPPGVFPCESEREGSGVNRNAPLLSDGEGPPGAAVYQRHYTAEQLRTNIRVVIPQNGGRIERWGGEQDGTQHRFVVFDRHGEEKRSLVVNQQGRVFEIMDDDESEEEDEFSNTIRLGLGDFIFYSVLVSKAALYSFATFAACMLVILAGLGTTLVLLAVYRHALPALPVSILLGVTFYILTRTLIEPWVQDILRSPLYV